jgi:hypothetical protein
MPRGPALRFCGLFFAFCCKTGELVIVISSTAPFYSRSPICSTTMPFPAARSRKLTHGSRAELHQHSVSRPSKNDFQPNAANAASA